MSAGIRISVIGHTVLIIWLLLGWGLSSDPLDFEVTEVTVVSGEEFAAIVRATTPDPTTDLTPAPEAPVVDVTPPAPQIEKAPVPAPAPEAVETPAAEAPPPAQPEPPQPPVDVVDTGPAQPQVIVPPTPDVTDSPRPQPRPAPRVASTPAALPPPDAQVADVPQDAVTPDAPEPAEVAVEEQDAAAPLEATTEIVTEAEKPVTAVTSSVRPRARPAQPAPQPQTNTAQSASAAEPTPDPAVDAAVAAALAAATSQPAAAAAGPPMTGSEEGNFISKISNKWIVDQGAEWATIIVTVGFQLGRDGRVIGDVRLLASTDGSAGAVDAAFQAARRAIYRATQEGLGLPPDKYDQWRDVELTFDPESMRLR